MKIFVGVLLLSLSTSMSFAQESTEDIEFQKLEVERTIINADAVKEDAAEAKEFAAKEKEYHDQLKAEAKETIAEAKKAEALAAKEAAKARKEGDKAQAQSLALKKQIKEANARKDAAEKLMKKSNKQIAEAQKRQATLQAQKTANLEKSKVLAERALKVAKDLKDATKAAHIAELEASTAKKKLKLAQANLERTQKLSLKKTKAQKALIAKHKADAAKSNKAKKRIDKSIAMLPGE